MKKNKLRDGTVFRDVNKPNKKQPIIIVLIFDLTKGEKRQERKSKKCCVERSRSTLDIVE